MRTTLRTVGRLDTTEGSVTLRMSVGIHSGEFDCYLVGDPHVHQEQRAHGMAPYRVPRGRAGQCDRVTFGLSPVAPAVQYD